VRFSCQGVEVHTATESPNLREAFARRLRAARPDVVLASTDDSAQILLQTALDSGVPVVYLARATIALPFGPDAAFPSEAKTAVLRRARAVVGVSRYVAEYVRRWSGIEAVALPISFMGPGPFPDLGRFGNEFVTLVNPCVVKGIDLFAALADAMPEVRFAAVPTWGTNESDFAKLRERRNITILDAVDDIDLVLARTRVLLVPSVWAEARSRIVVEAMLRGVPVVASNTGGLPEAKLGVPYVLPVTPISKYAGRLDERMVPAAEAPPQDAGPWVQALSRLTSDEGHWTEVSRASRRAAAGYLENELRIEPFEALLTGLEARPAAAAPVRLDSLSPEKRRLLALKLREQLLMPPELPAQQAAVVCFPWAGAQPRAYQAILAGLERGGFAAAAVRYPSGADSVERIVEILLERVAPKLPARFVLFGHSMGAGIAFEFARALRRKGLRQPRALIVSSATAPQLRTTVRPDPEPGELLAALARERPGPAEALLPFLPAFEAETRIYRRYLYRDEPALGIPVFAYRGGEDTVPEAAVEAWREQTSGPFAARTFAGGHLYVSESTAGLVSALLEDAGDAVG